MMKVNTKGVVLTGIAAYLIASKMIHAVERSVGKITTASVWKAYYKSFNKSGRTDMSEPFKTTKTETKDEKPSAASEALKTGIADAIKEVCNALKKDRLKGQEETSEEQTEASKEPKDVREIIELSSEKNMTNLEDGYDKIYIDWYPEDNDLCIDSTDSKIYYSNAEIEMMVYYPPHWWFEKSINPKNPDVRYIRNKLIKTDIALIKVAGHHFDVKVDEDPKDGDGE